MPISFLNPEKKELGNYVEGEFPLLKQRDGQKPMVVIKRIVVRGVPIELGAAANWKEVIFLFEAVPLGN